MVLFSSNNVLLSSPQTGLQDVNRRSFIHKKHLAMASYLSSFENASGLNCPQHRFSFNTKPLFYLRIFQR